MASSGPPAQFESTVYRRFFCFCRKQLADLLVRMRQGQIPASLL